MSDRKGYYIIIDDREKATIKYFIELAKQIPISIYVERLYIGDYAIFYNDTLIIIVERKTWKDLSQSIKDGRKDNVNKLLDIRKDTNCKIFYLIEGNACPTLTTKYARIPYLNLQSHLDHLIMRDNIHIIYSKNEAHTAWKLFNFITNIKTLKLEKKTGGNAEKKIKTPQKATENIIKKKILKSIKGVSDTMSTMLFDAKITIKDLLLNNIKWAQLAELKYPSGSTLGEKRAKNIIKNINDMKEKEYIKLLSSIPLISKPTAKILVSKYTLAEFYNNEISVDILKKISRGKNNLGKKSAENIIKYLNE